MANPGEYFKKSLTHRYELLATGNWTNVNEKTAKFPGTHMKPKKPEQSIQEKQMRKESEREKKDSMQKSGDKASLLCSLQNDISSSIICNA